KDYIPFHPSIKVNIIRGEQNIMLAAARNVLMRSATCDYIHYQDADDLLEPFCFEILKNKISEKQSELLINEVRSIVFDTNQTISNATMSLYTLDSKSDVVKFAIAGTLLAPSTTFKRSLGIKLGGYDSANLKYSEDFEFNIRLVYHAKSIEIIKKPLVIQRIRTNSLGVSNSKAVYIDAVKALEKLLKELPHKYRVSIAARASKIGRIMYQNGDYENARKTFQFAKKLYKEPFFQENFLYKLTSYSFGQYNAERISFLYRKFLPESFRRKKNAFFLQQSKNVC
ncbi:MAG: glycosyltransferase family 2 protein, partial [Bacteroidota bacterium]|nr:glycosyltransferase family 2 protein [Bacteroidota bacterium]